MVETGQRNALENVLENVLETSASLAAYFGVDARTIRRDLSALQAKDVPDTTVRLSIGLEAGEDLLEDIKQAVK